MDSKIFLRKYRVAAEEIESVGELSDSPLAYEGEEIHSGRKVVVEVVPAGPLKKAVRDQLEAEAVAARKLNHANIPALYDFGVEGDQLVYVSEDFDGTLAEEWVNAHGPMPLSPVLRIASQVVSALGAAAVYKIFHHAINPGNLVLVPGQTADGEWPLVKVLHFVGAAQKFSGVDVSVAAFDKSSHYTSPEQRRHGAVDFCSEIYSLGCTMWFLLTGAPPPAAKSGTTELTADKVSVMPKKVTRLLTQMLSVNRDGRPHDPLAFYRQLQDCLIEVERREAAASHSRVPAISEIGPIHEPRARRRPIRALAFAAILLALAALTALVVSAYLRHRRIVLAEEPIGVPIGVDDASASATPVTANVIVEIASASKVAVAPVSSAPTEAPLNPPIQEPAAATPTIASTPPAPIDASEFTSESQPTVGSSPLASPVSEPAVAIPSATPKEIIIMHEVRRAEPAEPEVRRAEPAPEDEPH